MRDEIKFEVIYKGKTYNFDYGSEVYIFHTALLNGMDKKHRTKTLFEYVTLVHDCYLADSNRTPLGSLADFMAENWNKVKKLGRYKILDKFYWSNY